MSSIDDVGMPKTVVARLVKEVLPEGMAVQKEVRTVFSRTCTVFVNYLVAAAHDRAGEAKRKVVTTDDVLQALDELQFQECCGAVQRAVKDYRARMAEKKAGKRAKDDGASAAEGANPPAVSPASAEKRRPFPAAAEDEGGGERDGGHGHDGPRFSGAGGDDGGHQAKRARVDA
ncbi:histone-fold-containing protein [Zopfochytrium polystomum]|nr:histone-fold-containing protein [Zopfochytrium polystomum]